MEISPRSRTVILMRHGRDYVQSGDLSPHGLSQIENVVQQLVNAGIRPQAVIACTKNKARVIDSKLAAVTNFGKAGIEVQMPSPDPGVGAKNIMAGLNQVDGVQTVMVIGHRHLIAAAVNELCGRPGFNLKHAQAIVIQSDKPSWNATRKFCSGRVVRSFKPRLASA